MKKVKGFIAALAISAVMAVVGTVGGEALLPNTAETAGPSDYQEIWSGGWADSRGAHGGRLEFILTGDGRINGKITDGGAYGSWNGYMRDDGVMVASYQYPTFGAYAVGRIIQQQGNRVFGDIMFGHGNTVFGTGQFELIRSNVSPQPANPLPSETPFTGEGREYPEVASNMPDAYSNLDPQVAEALRETDNALSDAQSLLDELDDSPDGSGTDVNPYDDQLGRLWKVIKKGADGDPAAVEEMRKMTAAAKRQAAFLGGMTLSDQISLDVTKSNNDLRTRNAVHEAIINNDKLIIESDSLIQDTEKLLNP